MKKYLLIFFLLFIADIAMAHGQKVTVGGYTFGDLKSKLLFALVFIIFVGVAFFLSEKKK